MEIRAKISLVFAIIILLSLTDITMTYIGIRLGIVKEGNPIAGWMFVHLGYLATFIIKLGFVFGLYRLMLWLCDTRHEHFRRYWLITIGVLFLHIWVVAWNFFLIIV